MRILVVEDDHAIAEPLAEGLRRHGHETELVDNGTAALTATNYDLVLLDLGLPDIDGVDVCRQLREKSGVPIIIISARDDESDRVLGLELGADDYLTKPFGMRELIARIRAVTRRTEVQKSDRVLKVGDLELDIRTRHTQRNGKRIDLTTKEFNLLLCLATDAGAVVSREEILESAWDTTWFGSSKTLDVHIASLRKKLGEPDVIETVRGVGYQLQAVQ